MDLPTDELTHITDIAVGITYLAFVNVHIPIVCVSPSVQSAFYSRPNSGPKLSSFLGASTCH